MYACLGVTYHLLFLAEWLESFTCHCGNTGVERTPNKSQHTKLTLEDKILLLLLLGFELATFQSRARRSNQQAIPAPLKMHLKATLHTSTITHKCTQSTPQHNNHTPHMRKYITHKQCTEREREREREPKTTQYRNSSDHGWSSHRWSSCWLSPMIHTYCIRWIQFQTSFSAVSQQ